MLPVTGNVNAQPRKISCKLEIGGNTITNVKMLTYSSDWSGNITVGQVVSSYISVTLPTPGYSLAGANVTLSMGIGTTVEWVQIGSFRVDEESIRTKQGYTSFNAYDKLYYSVNTYHSTGNKSLQTICNDVCRDIGITSTVLSADLTIDSSMLDGYTLRDVLGFIAGYQGKNAYLSPSGALDLRWFTSSGYTADGTRANIPYIGENDCTIGRWICQTQDGVIDAGSGEGIYFTCPFMTAARLSSLQQGQSLTYRKAEVDIPYGNFCLQSGDIITVTTVQNQTLTVPIMNNSWTYDGGLSSAVTSYGVSDYQGTANNAERSVSARRFQSILAEHKAANRVNEAIQEATDTITGATGGIIRINMGGNGKPAEFLILDTGDISTAQSVFRLNENGLGYSSSGYNGPYATAITAAGLIVTDRFVGNTISGVTLETIASGTGSRPKVVVENGSYELKRVATDETVHDVGVIKYIPRGDYDELDTVAIHAESGNAVVIGMPGNDEFIYYTDISAAPSGAEKFNFYGGHIRIYSSYEGGMISLQAKLHELEDRIAALGG
ncbi:hypothetical protein [Ruminococcus sp.]|uniref:hypothetical protein n=1 Tax=Ruminococcus sp. TaxID=41978 RepID=UPI001B4D3DF5|nr:hypothetical protein [Ruminococcus sp.]MBP5432241.1 hypothetical protein [Ruminococcus sp.]